MWFNIDGRDKKYRDELGAFIERGYKIRIKSMKEHKRGWYGETWKIDCADGRHLFAKIIYFPKQATIYQRCFPVLEYMKNNGIDFVSQFIPAANGESYLTFKGGTLGLFKFVDGIHADNGGTDDNPVRLAPYMVKIYNLPLPAFDVEREDYSYDTFAYLENQMRELKKKDPEAYGIVKANWDVMVSVNENKKRFAEICRKKQSRLYITSGDIGGNSLINDKGEIIIIDWDWIKLATPERDFCWYFKDPKLMDEINNAFAAAGFDYKLDMDIVSYWIYFNHIYFLTETIDCLLFNPLSRAQVIQRIKWHFDENMCFVQRLEHLEKLHKEAK